VIVGDFWSGVGALKVGQRRVQALVAKYGSDVIDNAIEALLDHSAARVTEGFRRLPKGTFKAEDRIDEDGLGHGPFSLRVQVTITDEDFIVDYSRSDPQAAGPVNSTQAGSIAAARQVFLSLTDPHASANEGCFRRVKVISTEGTICHARRPAPVSSHFETAIAAADIVWKALAEHVPHLVPAGQFGSICAIVITGTHRITGEEFVLIEPLVGGRGGGPDTDGESAQFNPARGETRNIPIEIMEARYGIVVGQYALNPMEGGDGEFRGGAGVVRDYHITEGTVHVSTIFGRVQTPAWSVSGGRPGTCNYVQVHRADGTTMGPFGKVGQLPLHPGDSIRLVTGAGGGWGSPEARSSEARDTDRIAELDTGLP
jgi:N-methylhydantoinase B